MLPEIKGFYDPATSTVSYVVYETNGCACAIIDPVLDYDASAARISTHSADLIAEFVQAQGLTVQWLLETHAHADHLSASAYLKQKLGAKSASARPSLTYNGCSATFITLSLSSDRTVRNSTNYLKPMTCFTSAPSKYARCMPGHTPADMAYQIEGNCIFVGDTLFMPDVGTARCDFPGGDARQLYQSIKRLLALPTDTRLFMCHDYPPEGRDVAWSTTVGEQRASNIHVNDSIDLEGFVTMRTTRDATLSVPQLLIPAIQINIRAGNLPPADNSGLCSLKVPLNRF